MRLWHQFLIPHLDRQRLLGQHRELAALRGKGWGKKHSVVDYVFTHDPANLVAYHHLIMDEMERRGYNVDKSWRDLDYRGKILGTEIGFVDVDVFDYQYEYAIRNGSAIYPEHDLNYLRECLVLLKEKEAPIDWDVIESSFGFAFAKEGTT